MGVMLKDRLMLNGGFSADFNDDREMRKTIWELTSAIAQILEFKESIEIQVSRSGRRIQAKITKIE